MEEKKQIKVSMSGFFLAIAIIIIAVMGYFIYKISTEKKEKENQVASLNNEISSLQSSSRELQGKIDNIANTISNTTNTVEKKLTAIEGTFEPQLEEAGDPPSYIFKKDGTVELAGNYSSTGTYTINGDEINIVYTKITGPDLDENINKNDKVKIIDENTLKSGDMIYKKETKSNKQDISSNIKSKIIGTWKVEKVENAKGSEIELSSIWGSGIRYSNEMTFKENNVFSYGIGITAGSGNEEYKIDGNIIQYSISTDIKGEYTWRTARYILEEDVIKEDGNDDTLGKITITYVRK